VPLPRVLQPQALPCVQAPPVEPEVRAVRAEWQTVPAPGAEAAVAVAVVARPPLRCWW